MKIGSLLDQAAPVMPVLIIDDAGDALALADALASGGLRVLEVTLRTAAALDAIEAIATSRPELVVGAGTVLSAVQMRAVHEAGGQFAVSPGFTTALAASAREAGLPFLPGTVTASEVQQALEQGLSSLKFFPAEAVGGTTLLRNFASVYPEVHFCPTGGIGPHNAGSYLALDNVICVGGSWVAPRNLVRDGDWQEITARARDASQTVASGP